MNAGSSGVVAEQSDRVRIPAELFDVLLDPLQGGDLVHQPVVGHPGLAVRAHVGVQEAWKKEIS